MIGPVADLLLIAELPELPVERRAEAVAFVQRRADGVPSLTRFGIAVIALFYRVVVAVPGGDAVARFLMSKPVPVLGEYPRLIRSLAFTYVWEHWPDTLPSGASC